MKLRVQYKKETGRKAWYSVLGGKLPDPEYVKWFEKKSEEVKLKTYKSRKLKLPNPNIVAPHGRLVIQG